MVGMRVVIIDREAEMESRLGEARPEDLRRRIGGARRLMRR